MICENCEREATVHEVVIRNGQTMERHLCDRCASQQGIGTQSVTSMPFTELMSKFVMSQQQASSPTVVTAPRGPACPSCGQSYETFKRTGLLGCPTCYASFEPRLGPLLERAHEGACAHVGKVPRRALAECRSAGDPEAARLLGTMQERAERVSLLRTKLAEAVRAEQYERAAAIRDELERLGEPGIGGSGQAGGAA